MEVQAKSCEGKYPTVRRAPHMTASDMEHDHTHHVATGFNQVAAGYDRPALRAFVTGANRLVELADLHNDQRVLEIGTGTGHAAIAAARAVEPEGWVIGVEIASDMREIARRKLADAGISNVELQEGDAAALPFDDNSFDAVICASAIYTLPDIAAALREWRRVLKPDGRIAFSSIGGGNDQLYYDLLQKYGIPLPPV